ncbi:MULTISPECIES: metallophosphoesterase [unclassified Pseudomonas]|uniref:metallophosphoesterase family protein n=1 Tax=unclassified Pseudomonas TaxID=196821 RepID=UPI0028936274|nr:MULTISPECIES: metallophosphoesterase [unclassified Pseudomonas]
MKGLFKFWRVCALVWVFGFIPSLVLAEQNPNHLIFASDPQYPWTDKTDSGEDESQSVKEERSRTLIERQFSDIASFRKNFSTSPEHIPIMINGDVTAYGHGWQRSWLRPVLNKYFGDHVFYGLGNHDYEKNDCFSESCAAGSITDFEEHHRDKVQNLDLTVTGTAVNRLYSGSLAYSRDVGDVHLVQLHNEPTYSVRISHFLNPTTFDIKNSLDWLEEDLKAARKKGQIIILNMHKPSRWQGSDEQVKRFTKIIEDYNVTAVFAGHLHTRAGRFWSADNFGSVPVYLSGAASQQTYLIASFSKDRKTLDISKVENNNWPSRRVVETIPVN